LRFPAAGGDAVGRLFKAQISHQTS
jgi:hypothetical protein